MPPCRQCSSSRPVGSSVYKLKPESPVFLMPVSWLRRHWNSSTVVEASKLTTSDYRFSSRDDSHQCYKGFLDFDFFLLQLWMTYINIGRGYKAATGSELTSLSKMHFKLQKMHFKTETGFKAVCIMWNYILFSAKKLLPFCYFLWTKCRVSPVNTTLYCSSLCHWLIAVHLKPRARR